MAKEEKNTHEIYTETKTRMEEYSEKYDLAIVTAFCGEEPDPERTKKMERLLSKLLYGYSLIERRFEDGSFEETFLIVSPDAILYENFRSTILSMADIFDRQAFILWSARYREGSVYMEDEPGEYVKQDTFTEFNIENLMQIVRNGFEKGSLHSELLSVTEKTGIGGGCSAYYGHRRARRELLDNSSSVKHACCFTGHRPERLGIPEEEVIRWLEEQIRQAVKDGYTNFISGMQRGVDIWAAEAVLKLKEEGAPVRLIASSPFEGMESRWDQVWQERYKRILSEADEVHYISSTPGRSAFFRRNRWMVDNSTRLIGVFTGAPGGTEETIKYARKKIKYPESIKSNREIVLMEFPEIN
ncbi:MAG: DUF1273 family protein [Firmicutes bacterium]|nr:DUF1273 family protein [Bacillota bacterium]